MSVIYEQEKSQDQLLSPIYLAVKFCYLEGNVWNKDLLNHLERVGAVFSILANEYCEINNIKVDLPDFWVVGFLHDIGKFEQRDVFSPKTGKFNLDQRRLAQRHPEDGVKILENIGVDSQQMLDIIFQHHERIDGNGYPLGLKYNQIDYLAQLLSIADILEASTSLTRGKFQFTKSWNEAYRILRNEAGNQYNRDLLIVLESCWSKLDYLNPEYIVNI